MKTRTELKLEAKTRLTAQFAPAVIIVLIYVALNSLGAFIALLGTLYGYVWLTASAASFTAIYRGQTYELVAMFKGTLDNLARKLGGMLWQVLFTFLWSMLFCIPGIIKALSYAMTPYILGDHPEVPAKDALKLSMRMMHGHKAELFVMYLSFIGWFMLSGLTFGILYIVYVGPYVNTTMGGYYTQIKADAIRQGRVTESELGASLVDTLPNLA
ncbi:membrane protein [Clostridia bacterium]|nr:membrane protein [Clostridia bacterium]